MKLDLTYRDNTKTQHVTKEKGEKQSSASNSRNSITWEWKEFGDHEEAGLSVKRSRNEGVKLPLRRGLKLRGDTQQIFVLTVTHLWKALKSMDKKQ